MVAAALLCSSLLTAQPRLAVMDVNAGMGIAPELARGLSDALTHEVRRRNPDVDVLGAGEIRAMLAVQREKSKLGCKDVSCLAEIGGALGAERIVTAALDRFGSTYVFTVQLVDVRRAHVVRDDQERLAGQDQGDLLDVVQRAVWQLFPGAAPAAAQAPVAGLSRISLIYDPEIPLTSGFLDFNSNPLHSIGFELSVPTGHDIRYHLQVAYANVEGISGFRVDPLTFGWAIPLVVQQDLRLEVEPTISFLDFITLVDSGEAGLLFSSGIGAQVNLGYGPLYVFVSPIGFELRYLGIFPSGLTTSTAGGTDDTGTVFGATAVSYRIRIGVGLQY